MESLKYQFEKAIKGKNHMIVDYQGNTRRIIPLISGVLKNGKEAVLCYRVTMFGEVIRLYHWNKISNSAILDEKHHFDGLIDFYLVKHFKSCYAII